jgi:thiol-disulfide isomerase/thioredoxin
MNAQLNAYYDACPASLNDSANFLLLRSGTSDMALKNSALLRTRLERERNSEMPEAWETLRNLEFKGNPPTRHDQVRKRLAADLERLRKSPHEKDVTWWATLQAGYKMASDETERRGAEDRIIADFPTSYQARRILDDRWSEEHPYPKPEDTAATGKRHIDHPLMVSDRQDDEMKKYEVRDETATKIERARLLVDAAELMKKAEIAKVAVNDLADLKPETPKQHTSLLAVKGKWAELNGRKLDALLLYREVLDGRPPDFKPPRDERDEIPERYDRLWKELGGTEEGRAILAKKAKTTEVASASGWEKPTKDMPAWELPDLKGKTWKLSSLQGKTVLINVWATWCGPCQAEHPHLQTLFEKLKERPDILIVTFDVDDEIGAVEPYINDHKYTFPVVLAKDLVNDLSPSLGIPQNWIVDAAGKWRWQSLGFGAEDEGWEKRVEEKLAATKSQ